MQLGKKPQQPDHWAFLSFFDFLKICIFLFIWEADSEGASQPARSSMSRFTPQTPAMAGTGSGPKSGGKNSIQVPRVGARYKTT